VIRWLSLALTFALLIASLVFFQTHTEIEAPVAPNALLYMVADGQRELTRLPMKFTRIPDADEIKIGNEIAEAHKRPDPTDLETRQIEAYIKIVGDRVAAHAARKLPYKFHYIPENYFVNAFAIPGGHVYIGKGLLALMENEDELAAVIGHEIEHIDHYHCAERLQVQAALRKVPLGQLIALPLEIFELGYSKDQELEADREGTRLAVAAGYSADGAIQLFEAFQKMEERMRPGSKARTPQEEIAGAAVQVLTGYFRSHPASADRIAQIESLKKQENWPSIQARTLEVRYIFLAEKAVALVTSAKYTTAIETANASLQLHPGYAPALGALARAKCALRDFKASAAAYHELLASHPAEADSVRTFAEQQASVAVAKKQFAMALQFVAFSLELQPDNSSSLTLLAQIKLEQSEMEAALEAGRRLAKLYPVSGSQLVQYANGASHQAFAAKNYERAARFAVFAQRLAVTRQSDLELLLAQSRFALADFPTAAQSYRKIIEADLRDEAVIDIALVRAYADALGPAPRHGEAAAEFQQSLRKRLAQRDDFAFQARMEEAGLLLMAGDESKATALTDPAAAIAYAPELAARLGLWYYRAGKLEASEKLLRRFLTQRPGDAGLQVALGWVELEKNMPADALSSFDASGDSTEPVLAGQSIARWRMGRKDEAVSGFARLIQEEPQWTNPAWVHALYGPVAAQSVTEMYAEHQRRLKKSISRPTSISSAARRRMTAPAA
jgi:predicted Zn-dependent protease